MYGLEVEFGLASLGSYIADGLLIGDASPEPVELIVPLRASLKQQGKYYEHQRLEDKQKLAAE